MLGAASYYFLEKPLLLSEYKGVWDVKKPWDAHHSFRSKNLCQFFSLKCRSQLWWLKQVLSNAVNYWRLPVDPTVNGKISSQLLLASTMMETSHFLVRRELLYMDHSHSSMIRDFILSINWLNDWSFSVLLTFRSLVDELIYVLLQ